MSVEFSGRTFESEDTPLWGQVEPPEQSGRFFDRLWGDEDVESMILATGNELPQGLAGMLVESQGMPYGGRQLKGPHYNRIQDILQSTAEMLASRQYTPEYIFPPNYMSPQINNDFLRLNSSERYWLHCIQGERNSALAQISQTEFLNRDDTTLWFDTPPFRYQGEHSRYKSVQNCLNACYRMVFEAVTGEAITEDSVTRAIYDLAGSHLIDDETLLNTFFTEVFKDTYDTQVNIWSITGATIKSLADYKSRISQRFPNKQVYAIVSLLSESGFGIWHTNVLIGANKDMVVCHDPRELKPTAFHQLSREDFENRWVKAYNRAHLIIADPVQLNVPGRRR